MGKKLGAVTWRSVALEGVPVDGAALDGFIGLEECIDYDHDSKIENKRKRKQRKKPNENHNGLTNKQVPTPTSQGHKRTKTTVESPAKKLKVSNGFTVEVCDVAKPSSGNSVSDIKNKNSATKDSDLRNKSQNAFESTKDKLGLDDMQAWMPYSVPEEILMALAEQGFGKPTKIQELCLPPAMLGRRDILGAAETGSGKTLAFGIPILAGIMKLKDNEEAGENVYDLAYKKTSIKRKRVAKEEKKSKSKRRNHTKRNKEEGIKKDNAVGSDGEENNEMSDDENSNDEINDGEKSDDENSDDEKSNDEISDDENSNDEINDGEKSRDDNSNEGKSKNETQDENDENSDDDYIHLSEILDSDDLEDSSDEENDKIIDPTGTDDESGDDESVDDPDGDAEENGDGIGCVKVIDNIELPVPAIVRTGRPLYALVIAPTRELAVQISRHLMQAAKYTGIRVATLVGGMAQVKQERLLAASPEVVVCTPGRLWELLQQGNPHLQQIDDIKFLAIDETDRMVERNHFEELQPLLERLNADDTKRGSRQNFVMSATLTMTHDLPSHLRGKKVTKRGKIINRKVQKMTPQQKTKRLIDMLGMTDPKIVDLTTENQGKAQNLTECRITCTLEQKDFYLFYVLRTYPGRTIVFCNSIGCVKRLAQLFNLLKCRPLPLHAGMPQRQRLKNMDRFRDDPRGVLVATDVAARGLDIPNVDHVIHYQVPRTAENYVHRSGRTARANKEGLTILMMEPGEAFLYSKLCRTLNRNTEPAELPVNASALAAVKQVVSLARDVEAEALRGKRRAQESGWLERAARDCDLIVDEDFVPMKKKLDESTEPASKALQFKKKQLDIMLSKPAFPKGFSYKYPSLNDPNALVVQSEENALQTVKRALESGTIKKNKRTSKNASLLSLQGKLPKKGIGRRFRKKAK